MAPPIQGYVSTTVNDNPPSLPSNPFSLSQDGWKIGIASTIANQTLATSG